MELARPTPLTLDMLLAQMPSFEAAGGVMGGSGLGGVQVVCVVVLV